MDTSRLHLVAASCAAALGAAACAAPRAAGPAPVLALEDAQGGWTTLDELRGDRDATVLVFWSASCPCVRRYQARADALLDAHPADRVRVVGVSSNAGEPFEDVLRTAAGRGVRIPILRDESGRVARALGVRSTPTVVLLDRSGAVRYLGWIDNERLPGEAGREPWLERALEGVLDGKSSFASRSPTWGCPITRSLFDGEHGGACCTDHPSQGGKP